ncbi:MAG: hypothetical protein H0X04_00020 [Chthoniobacterales bacterium]|nr:hypothetical protein [Chthoniobacterales bacterium]
MFTTSPIHHVEGSRAWLRDRLAHGCTLHAIADTTCDGHSRILWLELRWKRDGEARARVLTVLDVNGAVCDEQYQGLPLLTQACLSDIQAATAGVLARLVSESDADPLELSLKR